MNKSEDNIVDDFPKLSYDDVQTNLRLLCDLKENEKLMISYDNKYLAIDGRYLQCVRRYFTLDSRERTIKYIEYVIDETKTHCLAIIENATLKGTNSKEFYECLLHLHTLLNGTLTGLGRLSITYSGDKLSVARLETIQTNIRTFCEYYLKKPLI